MHSHPACLNMGSISIAFLRPTCSMNLNLECGRPFSYIYCGWLTLMVATQLWRLMLGRIHVFCQLFICVLTPWSLNRFREVPTFGRDTIRRFTSNVSGLKKLAARDFEDILQVRVNGFRFVVVKLTLVLAVRNTSFRGPVPQRPRPHHPTAPLRTCNMAWSRETPPAYWNHSSWSRKLNHTTWRSATKISVRRLPSIQNKGSSFRRNCSSASPSCKGEENHKCEEGKNQAKKGGNTRASYCETQKEEQSPKFEYRYIQNAFTRRLCSLYSQGYSGIIMLDVILVS